MSVGLIITAGVFYVLAAIETSRFLVGQWKYKAYLKTGKRTEFHEWKGYPDEGWNIFGALLISFFFLPVAAGLAFHSRGDGDFIIVPKRARQDQELRAAKKRIAQLEEETGVGVS